ncbi:MAG: alanyl-tRNA editing protein, partial [bacterium]|nr:alanyl-tRNA editing protein [bacterium]
MKLDRCLYIHAIFDGDDDGDRPPLVEEWVQWRLSCNHAGPWFDGDGDRLSIVRGHISIGMADVRFHISSFGYHRPMIATPSYWRDSYLTKLKTMVLSVGSDDNGPGALLEDSILYPEGGGQPADLGWVGDIAVEAIEKREDGFFIRSEKKLCEGEVELVLDWDRRYDHMQQHTGQHLLTSVADKEFGWKTKAFHLGAEVSDIELDVSSLSAKQIAKLEVEVNHVLTEDRPVIARSTTPAAMVEEGIRCRGLPENHEGSVRVIEIEGVDTGACGGTHLKSTAEIGSLCLLGTEKMRGGTRLRFIAGGRVLERLRAHENRATELRQILDTADGDMASVLKGKLEQLQEANRVSRRLGEDYTSALVERLISQNEEFQSIHFAAYGKDVVYGLARKFAAAASTGWLLITAGDGSFALVS